MSTFVLIPRPESRVAAEMSVATASASRGTPGRREPIRRLLRRLRARGTGGQLAVAQGVEPSLGADFLGSTNEPHPSAIREARAPRALDGIGAVIVDDLDEDQIEELLADDIDVVPNFLVPLEHPMASGEATGNGNWHLDHIGVSKAREHGLTGQGTRIGILDTGIDPNHPEFQGRSVAFMEFDENGYKIPGGARDAGAHGTHVSGIAAGNDCGVASKAELAVAAVLTVQTAQGLAGYFAQILAGLNWLLEGVFEGDGETAEVDIINASLGGSGYHDYLHAALDLAQFVSGTQMIASIGNAGPRFNSHGSPGNYNIVLGIGAVDSQDRIATFSSWGRVAEHSNLLKPDLCAPGVEVRSAVPGGGYEFMSGTSMASPCVAGAAALLIEQDPSLRTNPARLRQTVLGHTVPINPPYRAGRGRLDLANI